MPILAQIGTPQIPASGTYIANIIGALVLLVIGWFVAIIISRIVRGALRRIRLDARLSRTVEGEPVAALPISDWIATGVFWVILIFVLIAFFQTLRLTQITTPLNVFLNELLLFAPRLIGAATLIVIAWIIATILRIVVTRALHLFRLDERVGEQVGATAPPAPLSQTLGDVVYWLVLLLFLPTILGTLNLTGLLAPVQTMLDRAIGFLPNLAAAALILLVGWFVATVVRRILTSLLAAAGVDGLSARVGLAQVLGTQRLSDLIGLVAYVLILLPVLTAALNALALDAVTRPVSNMLNTILNALPNIFAAVLVLVISYLVGRVVAGLVANLLAGLGFDALPARLGLGAAAAAPAGRSASEVVGSLVLATIMLFASIEASRLLGFVLLAELIAQFTVFAGQVILGLIIFAIGLYVANLGARVVRASGLDQAELLAQATRAAILVLAAAMGLRQMGLANEIVNLAFGLLLGTIAVAVALAFGIGGRDIAARELDRWLAARRSAGAGEGRRDA